MGIDGLVQIALDDILFLGHMVGFIGIRLMFIIGHVFGYKKSYIGYNDSLLLSPVLFLPLGGQEEVDWCEGY